MATRSELLGNTKSKTALVEQIARWNSLNRTGKINYNEGGRKDNIGLRSVTEKFVDNFLLRVLVADYNTEKGKNIYVGTQNKTIRDLLAAHELEKCIVKAVTLKKLDRPPSDFELEKMPMRNPEKIAEQYYYQEYKVACPNIEYKKVMEFLRTTDLATMGMAVKDFDVTMDYAGSFNKKEIIDHLVSKEDFQVQGGNAKTMRTIVDNDATVGRNCLTYMETANGICMRKKVYNKMVQMLECKSVRSSVGCHWKDWVCQEGTRLADARDKTNQRGLTRAEVTFYVENHIPADDVIEDALSSIVKHIPSNHVYSTPFAEVWRVYCNTFVHSLVCIDRTEDVGLLVYSYNEITGKISGESYENWSEREKWCLDKLTLNGNLPLDVIDITSTTIITSSHDKKIRKDIKVELSGSRYYKINQDSSTLFKTRLVSLKGLYSFKKNSPEANSRLLENAGLVVHENCHPHLASSKASHTSKADAELRKVDSIDVQIEIGGARKRNVDLYNSNLLKEEARHLEEIRKPLLLELRKKEIKLRTIQDYKKKFTRYESVPLRELTQRDYTVLAARKQNTRFGETYKLLVEVDGETYVVWSNAKINGVIDSIPKEEMQKLLDTKSGIMCQTEKELATLSITGRGTNSYGLTKVFCKFVVNHPTALATREVVHEAKNQNEGEELTTFGQDNLLPYREYRNLTELPLGSANKVSAIGYAKSYGEERLVVKIGDNFYQAGDDVESNVENLKLNSILKIEKICTRPARHTKYAVCSIYEPGDWTACMEFVKTPMLKNRDGSTCIVDVKTIDVRGKKRTLLLTDQGMVYRLKQSKLEDTVQPGYL